MEIYLYIWVRKLTFQKIKYSEIKNVLTKIKKTIESWNEN